MGFVAGSSDILGGFDGRVVRLPPRGVLQPSQIASLRLEKGLESCFERFPRDMISPLP